MLMSFEYSNEIVHMHVACEMVLGWMLFYITQRNAIFG